MVKEQLIAGVLLLVPVLFCDGANILAFYPFPGVSHHKVYWPLVRELAIRGHNVTMVSPFNMADPPKKNYKEIKVPNYADEVTTFEENMFFREENPIMKVLKSENLFMLREMGVYFTEMILKEPIFKWLISSDSKFDLVISEFSFGEEAFVMLADRFKAHHIEMTSFGNFHWAFWMYGNPFDPSYIVDMTQEFSDRMSFTERFQNTMFSMCHRLLWYYYYMPKQQLMADTYIRYPGWEKRMSVVDIMNKKTSLYLINTHYSLNYAYPLAPNVKEIGGINMNEQIKPLPKDLKQFMDEAPEGVIYFSMGSYFNGSTTFNESVRDDFIRLFSSLKQRVLWKWEKNIDNLPKNIKISKWLPQPSILSHPKCRLFISHGGFLSLSETIDKGVPVIAMPVFADQFRNAESVAAKGIGIRLDLAKLTSESIKRAINEILTNPSYKKRITEQSKIFRDKPETALETAVFWTEYVIRHNGAHHLKPAIATMPWYQQAMIDVYLSIAIIILMPLLITYKLFACILRTICGRREKKIVKKQKMK